MGDERNQKVFYYRNTQSQSVIEGLLKDEAKIKGRKSVSYLIERHILDDFLPKNEVVASWVESLYLKNENGESACSLRDVTVSIFKFLASNLYLEAKVSAGKFLADYAYRNKCISNCKLGEYDEEKLQFLKAQLNYVIERLSSRQKEIGNETIEEKTKKMEVEFELKELEQIEEDEKITDISVSTIYLAILNNWDMLYDFAYTYWVLASLAQIQNWVDTPETRMDLVNILNKFADSIEE